MKMKLLVLLVPLALAVPAAAEAAAAAPQQAAVDSPTPIRTTTCFPNTSKAFTVNVFAVENKEKVTTTTSANGDVVIRTTGKLVLKFQNATTGKAIVRNVSGPTTETIHPDGSILFEGAGNNWFGIGPQGQANTGEPGLVFTSGNVTVTVANRTVQTFSLKGHQENGCALLS